MYAQEETAAMQQGVMANGVVGQLTQVGVDSTSVLPQQGDALTDALVMIVDDEDINIEVARSFLEDVGYHNFVATDDSTKAIETIIHEHPDVVLLDLIMPQVNGFQILEEMRGNPQLQHIPVVVLTASTDAESKHRALEMGATDFLQKPVDPSELALRLKNTLSAKAYQDHLANYSAVLEEKVRERTEQLEAAHLKIIHCLARAAEFRDDDTGKHVIRVGRYAATLARQMGAGDEFVERICVAAQLHDVGKIGVPDAILLKPDRLDPQEYLMIKQHCDIGMLIINGQKDTVEEWQSMARHTNIGATIMSIPETSIMQMAAVIAETHHERWDGSGYPNGLKGRAIPIEGRITAVADVYDALTSKRPYKKKLPQEKCFSILREERGKHFDPQVVDAFFAAESDITRIQNELAD